MKQLVDIIERIIPVYLAEATANARAPYAAYDMRETPIRTKSGIAGYEGTFQLSIFCVTDKQAAEIADTIVTAIDTKLIGEHKYYYADCERSDYPDVGLVSRDLTFNTLR